jgi:transcription-repair coupling factor (superfamily II helicase)
MAYSGAHNDLLDAVGSHPRLRSLLSGVSAGEGSGGVIELRDASEQAWPFLAAVTARRMPAGSRIWFVCRDVRSQEEFASELAVWIHQASLFPDLEVPAAGLGLPDPETASERIALLGRIAGGEVLAPVITTAQWEELVPSVADLTGNLLSLPKGWKGSPGRVIVSLEDSGYERVAQVTRRGEFALRGGILDLFSWQQSMPCRLEFDEDGIVSIREFDLDTQTSVGEVVECVIQMGDTDRPSVRLADYLKPQDLVVEIGVEEASGEDLMNKEGNAEAPFTPPVLRLFISSAPASEVFESGGEHEVTAFDPIPFASFGAGDFVIDEARRQEFFRQLDSWRKEGWRILLLSATEGEAERFRELALALPEFSTGENLPEMRLGAISRGFCFPAGKLAVLSDAELFGRSASQRLRRLHLRREKQRASRSAIDFTEFEEGQLVVHTEHGIGRYLGLQSLPTADGTEGEVLALEFADDSRLFVPIDQAWQVSRYVGVGKHTPDLSSLGDDKWSKARKAAEKSVFLYAGRLLKLQAERETGQGHAFGPDTPWQRELEMSFPYRETADQLRAISEIKQDMESRRPMDRLLCGDVGFGKTEVALRAAFKALMGGKQVVFLAPTTVLAQQHVRTLRERMSEYPVKIELLSRYRTAAEQREVVKGLADGSVDLVVGTHRLLSPDVIFKDIGMVIVDEEQRFGVKHKEALKERFRLIDVLTLSATPIPRTLYLSLMGARDMSVIETPPPDRQPVETVICAYDERVIRDAIQRERARGGQVYLLHNRIGTIEKVASRINELCPGARVLVGHGQMEEGELEGVMKRFVEGEADVLVSTTIIESGLDIPNANTIIIDRADRFGLADLYQLRGRVGRGRQKAYAYLMLPRDMIMVGEARRRVQAIRQYSQLGAGFRIAMRDLEIRGAGNLLGTAQSGQIAAVGFDLYCRMLRQAVARMKGESAGSGELDPGNQSVLRLDFVAMTPEELARSTSNPESGPKISRCGAFIPSAYLPEAKLRIEAHRSLASAPDVAALDLIAKAWRDRFGPLPQEISHLFVTERIRRAASAKGITKVETRGERLMLTRRGDFLLMGHRFPRLTASKPASKLSEILRFLEALKV